MTENGDVVLSGQRPQGFPAVTAQDFAKDINAPSRIRRLVLFDFCAFLNMATPYNLVWFAGNLYPMALAPLWTARRFSNSLPKTFMRRFV